MKSDYTCDPGIKVQRVPYSLPPSPPIHTEVYTVCVMIILICLSIFWGGVAIVLASQQLRNEYYVTLQTTSGPFHIILALFKPF